MPKIEPKYEYVSFAEFCINRIQNELSYRKYFGRYLTLFDFYEPIQTPWWRKFFGAEKLVAKIENDSNTIDVYSPYGFEIFIDLAEKYEKYSNNTVAITINNHVFRPDPSTK